MYKQIIKDLSLYLNVSHLSDATKGRYYYCIIKFLNFVEENNKKIDLKTVTEYLNYLKEGKKRCVGTINDYRSAIKYLFEVVTDNGWNNRKVPRLKGYDPIPVCLSLNETRKLFLNAKNILYLAILTTMYSSGLRISEAINIKFEDIDSERNTVYIRKGKNGKSRYADLSNKNIKILRDYYKKYWRKRFGKSKSDNYLFCIYNKNTPITSRTVRGELKKAAKKANIKKKLTPHTLRHSIAVHMLESGIDLIAIQRFMGHKAITSTCIYLRLANVKKLGYKNPFDTGF
jgi:integrase/recombinase XerD